MVSKKAAESFIPPTVSTARGRIALGLVEIGRLHPDKLAGAGFTAVDRAELECAVAAFETEHDGFVRDRSRMAHLTIEVARAVAAATAFRSELLLATMLLELKGVPINDGGLRSREVGRQASKNLVWLAQAAELCERIEAQLAICMEEPCRRLARVHQQLASAVAAREGARLALAARHLSLRNAREQLKRGTVFARLAIFKAFGRHYGMLKRFDAQTRIRRRRPVRDQGPSANANGKESAS